MAHMDWEPSHLSDIALYKLVCVCVCVGGGGGALYKPVWGGCLSGSMRCWNDMAHMDWDPSHLSDIALYKPVWGGCCILTCVGRMPLWQYQVLE